MLFRHTNNEQKLVSVQYHSLLYKKCATVINYFEVYADSFSGGWSEYKKYMITT